MSFPYLNPISPLRVFGPESVSREKSYGTNFSTLSVGGYMEVFSLDQLRYVIPPLTYGQVNYSGNSIPITYSVGSGSTYSYDTLILNPDNISSGRKKIGMLVYVKDENQVYQFNINNYDTLWNAATGATGVGGSTVVVSSFGTTVKANTPEGVAFISGWTANTIDGVSGYTYETAVWKKYYGSNLSVTGGTFDADLGVLSLTNITGGTVNISGYTTPSMTGSPITVGVTPIFSGNSGGVLFQNSSNILSQNPNLFWDNTNSRLGINNTSPEYNLDVSGNSMFRGTNFSIGSTGIVLPTVRSTGTGTVVLGGTSPNTPSLRLQGSNINFDISNTQMGLMFGTGNLTLQNGGTFTDAGFRLDVVGDVRINSTLTISTTPSYPGLIGFNRNVNTGSILNPLYGAYQIHNEAGVFEIQGYNTGGTFSFQHTIFNNGNFILGGSASPVDTGNRLDVVGNAKLRSNTFFGSIVQPSTPTLTSNSTTGGTLSAATYYYRIVAVDFYGNTTTPSNELVVTTTGSTSRISLSWTLVSGAYSYRIYRGTTSGGQNLFYTVSGTNGTSFTDTGAAGTAGSTPTINQTAYGSYGSNGNFRTGNITIVNNGVGNYSSIIFDKSTDSPQINVVEYSNDSTMFEFSLRDNPDGVNDFFHWVFPDWQNSSTGWKPLKFSDLSLQFIGLNSNFWSSFLLPSSTPYFTTNPETLANSSIKFNPYTSNTYNLIKDNGTGTGNLNVEISGYTNTISRIYWVTIQAGNTTFNWGTGSNSAAPIGSNITITGGWQTLDLGTQIRITGSVLAGDRWSFRAFPVPRLGVGTTTPTAPLQVSSTVRASSSSAIGMFVNPTLVATANNDVLVGVDINPTFTVGAFTGVSQFSIRAIGTIRASTFDSAAALRLSSGGLQAINFYLNSTSYEIARFFATTGNLLLQNGGTFTDAGFRLDVNGTARIQNQLTTTGSITASSGTSRGTFLNQTLVAAANNDTLYALDITPSFTTGSFTGVTSVPLRIRNSSGTGNAFFIDGIGNGVLAGSLSTPTVYNTNNINLSSGLGNLSLQTNFAVNTGLVMFNSTRNIVIQNGGTFTDAGFRLDVSGNTRINGGLTATTISATTYQNLPSDVLIINSTQIQSGTTGNILFQSSANTVSQNSNLFWDNTNSRLGIGTRSPSYSIDVSGLTLANSSVSAQGSFNVNPLAAPTAITGYTLSAGSSLGVGTYYYFVVYVTSIGETNAGGILTVVTTSGNTTVNLSGIPISSDPRVTARKLYRTKLGGTSDNQWFLATISNNTTTTYTDSIADASLTGANLQAYKVNTTSRYITVSGIQGMVIDPNLTAFGRLAGSNIISNSSPAVRTVLIGASAGQNITTGQANVIVGVAGGNINTGSSNTLVGDLAGYVITTASGNVVIGSQTARYLTTGGNNIIIGSGAASLLSDGVTQFTQGTNNTVIGRSIRMLTVSDTNSIVIGDVAFGLGSNTTVIGNSSTTFSSIFGNLGVATTTNAGFRLDVNGTSRFVSDIRSNTGVYIGSTTTLAGIFPQGISGRESILLQSSLSRVDAGTDITITNGNGDPIITGSTRTLVNITRGFAPTGGTGVFNVLSLQTTINQTGGSNGITRGLYVNPTLTSSFDFRAIETTLGNVMLNTVSGNTLIGTTVNTGQKLQVSGNTLINGGLTATTITAINPTKNQYICDIGLAADQTITTSADTLIDFIDITDDYNWYDPSSRTFRPDIEGYYHIDFNAWFDSSTVSTGQYNIQLRKNGNTVSIIQQPTINNGVGQSLFCSKLVYLNGTTDYLDFTAYQSTGVNRRLQVGASSSGTYVTIFLLAI